MDYVAGSGGTRFSFVGAALVLALGAGGGLIASTVVASRAYTTRGEQAKKSDQNITVTGSARSAIRSDLAVWRIHVRGDSAELNGAFDALARGADRVRKFLSDRKFTDGEVSAGSINTETHYTRDKEGRATRTVGGYTLTRTIEVTTARVDDAATAAAAVTELIKDGVMVVSVAPEFHYTKLSELKIEMLGRASKDARARADAIAANSGCRVSDVRNARMGVLQITRPHSTETSAGGVHDTGTIDKDVTAVVTLTLGVEGK